MKFARFGVFVLTVLVFFDGVLAQSQREVSTLIGSLFFLGVIVVLGWAVTHNLRLHSGGFGGQKISESSSMGEVARSLENINRQMEARFEQVNKNIGLVGGEVSKTGEKIDALSIKTDKIIEHLGNAERGLGGLLGQTERILAGVNAGVEVSREQQEYLAGWNRKWDEFSRDVLGAVSSFSGEIGFVFDGIQRLGVGLHTLEGGNSDILRALSEIDREQDILGRKLDGVPAEVVNQISGKFDFDSFRKDFRGGVDDIRNDIGNLAKADKDLMAGIDNLERISKGEVLPTLNEALSQIKGVKTDTGQILDLKKLLDGVQQALVDVLGSFKGVAKESTLKDAMQTLGITLKDIQVGTDKIPKFGEELAKLSGAIARVYEEVGKSAKEATLQEQKTMLEGYQNVLAAIIKKIDNFRTSFNKFSKKQGEFNQEVFAIIKNIFERLGIVGKTQEEQRELINKVSGLISGLWSESRSRFENIERALADFGSKLDGALASFVADESKRVAVVDEIKSLIIGISEGMPDVGALKTDLEEMFKVLNGMSGRLNQTATQEKLNKLYKRTGFVLEGIHKIRASLGKLKGVPADLKEQMKMILGLLEKETQINITVEERENERRKKGSTLISAVRKMPALDVYAREEGEEEGSWVRFFGLRDNLRELWKELGLLESLGQTSNLESINLEEVNVKLNMVNKLYKKVKNSYSNVIKHEKVSRVLGDMAPRFEEVIRSLGTILEGTGTIGEDIETLKSAFKDKSEGRIRRGVLQLSSHRNSYALGRIIGVYEPIFKEREVAIAR